MQLTFMQRCGSKRTKRSGSRRRSNADSGLSRDPRANRIGWRGHRVSNGTELLAGGSEAINYTNYLFQQIAQAADATGAVAASKFYTVGETMGLDFMAALNSQAEKATIFAQRVQQLVEAGMSKEAIAQVLAAGATAGTEIADYLLVAGSNRILGEGGVNDIVASLQIVGDTLGKSLAPTFYQAGVTLAGQIVAGLRSQLGRCGVAEKDSDRRRRQEGVGDSQNDCRHDDSPTDGVDATIDEHPEWVPACRGRCGDTSDRGDLRRERPRGARPVRKVWWPRWW